MATVPYTSGFYGLSKDFPYVSAPSVFQQLDTIAQNDIGTRFAQVLSLNAPGKEQTILRYVQYVSIATPAPVAFPAPVYWTDLTFSKVSGVTTEGMGLSFLAGWLLPNTTTIAGLTAAQLNNQFCWIAVGGYVAGAFMGTATPAKGDTIVGAAAGNWAVGSIAAGTAITSKPCAFAVTAEAGTIADIIITSGYTI